MAPQAWKSFFAVRCRVCAPSLFGLNDRRQCLHPRSLALCGRALRVWLFRTSSVMMFMLGSGLVQDIREAERPLSCSHSRCERVVQSSWPRLVGGLNSCCNVGLFFSPSVTYNKAKRYSPLQKWKCWKGCWGSETPRLHSVSCESSVDWNPYSSIGFARQCGCTNLWLNLTATQWKRSWLLTCSWVHGPMIAGQPVFFLPWMVWHNRISSNRSCKIVSPLISAILSQTSGRDTWSNGHLILKRIRENTTVNAPLITNGVLFLQKGLWSLIRLTSFPNT